MSEMIVVECDYKDGECLERFSGFSMPTTERQRNDYLRAEGWAIDDDGKQYCPTHNTQGGE